MGDESKKNRRTPPPTSQLTLLVRAILGAYLVYLAFDLRENVTTSIWYAVAAVVFGVVGAVLVILSVRRIFSGDFDLVDNRGQRLDPDDLPEEDELEELERFGEDLEFLEDDDLDADTKR